MVQRPPEGMLPGVVPLELVLAKTDKAAVCLTRIGAYPTGFEIQLLTMVAEEDSDLDPMLFGPHRMHRRGRQAREIPDGTLRFGVQFADGLARRSRRQQPRPTYPGPAPPHGDDQAVASGCRPSSHMTPRRPCGRWVRIKG